jgi:hypothetical protein
VLKALETLTLYEQQQEDGQNKVIRKLSLRPAAIAYASRVSLGQHSIILCSFAYNFISNLH